MIRDLDDTLKLWLKTYASPGSLLASATISFELPDSQWRGSISTPTVNCYLYDIRQNPAMQTSEPLIAQSADKLKMKRIRPPVRIDCAYCITAWSPALTPEVAGEHRLLSDVLRVLIRHTTIPQNVLQGSLASQFPPYPGIVASQEGAKNLPDFWNALDQKLKPSLNYIITLAVPPDDIPTDAQLPPVVSTTVIEVDHL